MTEYKTILPPTSKALEFHVDETVHTRIDGVEVNLRQIGRPYDIKEELLPWLAWGEDTKVWLEEWGPDKRRDVIAGEPFRKAKLGTARALRDYVRIAGSEILKLTVPPASFYWGEEDSELLENWRKTLSQLRIYPYMERGPGPGMFFSEDYLPDEGDPDWPFDPSQYFMPDLGNVYRQRQAYLYDDGQMIPLPWASNYEYFAPEGTIEQWAIPHVAAPGDMFWEQDNFWDADFINDDLVDLYTLTLQRANKQDFLRTGVRVASTNPDIVSEPFVNNPAFLLDLDYWDDAHFLPEDGYARYYERYYVYRPGQHIDPIELGGYGYYNTSTMVYGIPPFTAEALVDTTRTMPVAAIVDDWTGFWLPEDTVRFDRAVEALRVAKAARDTVYANPQAHRNITLGDRPTLPFRLGKTVETY